MAAGLTPVDMGISLGTSLLGGIANYMADQQAYQEEQKRKQAAIQTLSANLINPTQLQTMLNNVDRLFNSRLVGALNTTAVRNRGVANAPVVAGAIAGSIQGQEAQARINTQDRALQYNNTTRSQIAQIQNSGSSFSGVGSAVSGLLTALPTGIELAKLNNPDLMNVPNKYLNQGTDTTATGDTNYNLDQVGTIGNHPRTSNPFGGKAKITNDMLNNFSPISQLQRTISMGF